MGPQTLSDPESEFVPYLAQSPSRALIEPLFELHLRPSTIGSFRAVHRLQHAGGEIIGSLTVGLRDKISNADAGLKPKVLGLYRGFMAAL